MEQTQLELDFGSPEGRRTNDGTVVVLSAYAEARNRKLKEVEQSKLLAEIVKSVEHITGRSPDAEMM